MLATVHRWPISALYCCVLPSLARKTITQCDRQRHQRAQEECHEEKAASHFIVPRANSQTLHVFFSDIVGSTFSDGYDKKRCCGRRKQRATGWFHHEGPAVSFDLLDVMSVRQRNRNWQRFLMCILMFFCWCFCWCLFWHVLLFWQLISIPVWNCRSICFSVRALFPAEVFSIPTCAMFNSYPVF